MADFKVGDRVVFNCERMSKLHHGLTGTLKGFNPSHYSRDKWQWAVVMDNFTVDTVYIDAKYLEMERPLSPFDQKVRAYIQRELHG